MLFRMYRTFVLRATAHFWAHVIVSNLLWCRTARVTVTAIRSSPSFACSHTPVHSSLKSSISSPWLSRFSLPYLAGLDHTTLWKVTQPHNDIHKGSTRCYTSFTSFGGTVVDGGKLQRHYWCRVFQTATIFSTTHLVLRNWLQSVALPIVEG